MATLGWSTQDGWSGYPAPVTVSAEAGLICPHCQKIVSHMQVLIYEPDPVPFVLCQSDLPRVTGYTVIPCLHEVSSSDYDLIMRDGLMSFEPKG